MKQGEFDIYPPGLAARMRAEAGKAYRPANGTEGMLFEEAWCEKCLHGQDRDAICTIFETAFWLASDHANYPTELRISAEGQPECTAFERIK